MRQLLNWRFAAAIVALAVLALLVRAVFVDDSSIASVVDPVPIERKIDLIEPIAVATPSDGFSVGADGTTTGFLDLLLDAERIVRIAPGTYGEVDCDELDQPNGCAIFADMLGDAVVWFAILPTAPRSTVELPPIVDLDAGDAVFANGWRIPYAPVIERDCGGIDIATFSDFLRRFGPDSTTIVDLASREVTRVRCGDPVTD